MAQSLVSRTLADRPDLETVSKELYEVLVTITKGEAKLMIKNVLNNDGVLAYHRLYRHHNRRTLARVLRMTREALHPKAVHDLKQLISKVKEWEDKWARMAAEDKETLPVIWKMAALMELCPPDVQDMVYQNVDGVSEDYDNLKQRILAWAEEDVGAVTMNTVCHGCGGCGHLTWECPTLQRNEKANRKGKGKKNHGRPQRRRQGRQRGWKRRLQRKLLQVRKTRTQGRGLQDPSEHGGRV